MAPRRRENPFCPKTKNTKMVTAIMIVEMMGKPADYLKKSLDTHINNIKNRKSVEVLSSEINEPKTIEESDGFFGCFAEVEVKVETLKDLFDLVFDYMPASVEVVDPKSVSLGLEESTSLLNNMAGRLHRYDEVAKNAKFKIDHLLKQVQIATKVLEDNGLAKDGKLVDSVARKLASGENTGKAKKKVSKKKAKKKK
jgi:hypothetical protein